ncbi:glycosyltransferase family 17 protein [Mycena floridula]|nr:glycosyltransferase family 17 protein [Mycena floridula]
MIRPQRMRALFLVFFLFLLTILYVISQNHYQLKNALAYGTRPLWDKADGPTNVIPHYYAEGMPFDSHTCQLHGWKERQNAKSVTVFDAVLMSSELDLLEIRMNELDSVVDRFFILESNATFTGLPKETYFANNRARFSNFEKKISYHFLPGYPLPPGKVAFDVEAKTRDAMTQFLRSHIAELRPETQPLVLMSDVDEIPSAHSIKLLRACDFGSAVHLQLRNYLYSFEWFLGFGSWRASVQSWTRSSFYRHSLSTPNILADSGWHCSYCFKTLPEYVVKMKGFSHSDRIGGRINLLEPSRIQSTICTGKDIFGMLPEAYTYADLLSQMNPLAQTSAVGLPRFLIVNALRFKFLLPGGCKRDSAASGSRKGIDDDLE